MARRQEAAARPGSGFGQGVIILPAALTEALSTGGRAHGWTDAERAMLRSAYALAASNHNVGKLAAMWHTLGKGFPRRSQAQLSVMATRLGCTSRQRSAV